MLGFLRICYTGCDICRLYFHIKFNGMFIHMFSINERYLDRVDERLITNEICNIFGIIPHSFYDLISTNPELFAKLKWGVFFLS